MMQQGLNFMCHFGDLVAVDDNVLFLNEHWNLRNDNSEVENKREVNEEMKNDFRWSIMTCILWLVY